MRAKGYGDGIEGCSDDIAAELEAANARVATLSTELRIEKNMRRDLEVKVKELTAQLAQK